RLVIGGGIAAGDGAVGPHTLAEGGPALEVPPLRVAQEAPTLGDDRADAVGGQGATPQLRPPRAHALVEAPVLEEPTPPPRRGLPVPDRSEVLHQPITGVAAIVVVGVAGREIEVPDRAHLQCSASILV